MPELPEIEVIRIFLNQNLLNKTIKQIEVFNPKSFVGDPKLIEGQKIISFTRIGKQLSIHLSNNLILLFHLKMTGQIIYLDQIKTILGHPTPSLNNSNLPNKSTRVIFYYSDNSQLFFNDQRKFGWIRILKPKDLKEFQSSLGLDVLGSQFTNNYFYTQLQKTSRPIKTVLLDQTKMAGIGNIYANDALFLAGIHPLIPANKINLKQSRKLRISIINLIKESISHGGSTAKDNKYILPDGSFGTHQYHFRVYQRESQPCLVCQTPISRIKTSGRSSFFCPKCQPIW